jgi:hypothetical protein
MPVTFQCYTCGGHNAAGQGYCSWCGNRFYYNCPQCGTWVDNNYANCPNCRRELGWGRHATQPKESSKSAALVTLLATVLLFAVAFILIENNAGPARQAYSSGSTPVAASSAGPTQVTLSPQIPGSYQSAPAQIPNLPLNSPDIANPATDTAITEISFPTISTTSSRTSNSQYVPVSSSYLQQLWPGWGHCSGGSCR